MRHRDIDFSILDNIDQKLKPIAQKAYANEFDDPLSSIKSVWTILKQILKWVGEKSNTIQLPRESAFEYQKRLVKSKIIPNYIDSTIHTIREWRNKAEYELVGDASTASHILNLFETILQWLEKTHGSFTPAALNLHSVSQNGAVPNSTNNNQNISQTSHTSAEKGRHNATIPISDTLNGGLEGPHTEPIKNNQKVSITGVSTTAVTSQIPSQQANANDPLKLFVTPHDASIGGTFRLYTADGLVSWVNVPPNTTHKSIIQSRRYGAVAVIVGPTHHLEHDSSGTSVKHVVSTKLAKFGGATIVHTPAGYKEIIIPAHGWDVDPLNYGITVSIPEAGVIRIDGSRFDLDVYISAVATIDAPQEGVQKKNGILRRLFSVLDD